MKLLRYIFLAAVSACLFSCTGKKVADTSVIPLTLKILEDTTSYGYRSVAAGRAGDSRGTIAVIGAPEDALLLSEELISCDLHDNISGTSRSDGLPDFAGETFAEILDFANYPYGGYLSLGNSDFLKEVNLRNFLSAVDTVCLQSPFDSTGTMFRQRAKAVIFASSSASAYGQSDIDSLLSAAGSPMAVITPVSSMAGYVLARRKGPVNMLVWGGADNVKADVYAPVLSGILAERGDGSRFSVFASHSDSLDAHRQVRRALIGLLDRYTESGGAGKIDAILLDERGVSYDEFISAVAELQSTDEDNLLQYRNMLSEDLVCVSAARAIADECNAWLRKYNAFTHRVAYPDLKFYITYPSVNLPEDVYDVDGGFSFAYKYSRKTSAGQPDFSLVELRDRYFPESMAEFMQSRAPKSYSIYVR